jgi:hypothetical protein
VDDKVSIDIFVVSAAAAEVGVATAGSNGGVEETCEAEDHES